MHQPDVSRPDLLDICSQSFNNAILSQDC